MPSLFPSIRKVIAGTLSLGSRRMSFKIACSVVTGLEKISQKEIREVFAEESELDLNGGRVFFHLQSLSNVKKVTDLRSVEHVFSVVDVIKSEQFLGNAEDVQKYLALLPDQLDWSKAVEVV